MTAPAPRSPEDARSAAPSYELTHVALTVAVRGKPLCEVTLTDQRSLALVLQVAALLAHLEHGGWRWTAALHSACVTPEGLLQVAPAPGQGRAPELAQVTLRRLLLQLFRGEGAVSGRGVARSAARQLIERWQQTLIPLSADRAVAELFAAAPFLWEPHFAPARVALLAEHRLGAQSHLWLAGPGVARRRFLALAGDRVRLARLLASARAQELWEGWRSSDDPRQLTAAGRWRRATVAWGRRPPHDPADRFAYAHCLFALGKYTPALEALKNLSDFESRLLRAWCQTYLGELNAAHGTVRALADSELSAEQTVRTAEVAIRLLAKRGQRDEIREWVARCFVGAHGKPLLHACIVAAGAAWDCEDLAAMEQYLERSRHAIAETTLAVPWLHTRGLLSIAKGDGDGGIEHIGAALQRRRRRLLASEAARLWNDLAIGRASAGDLAGAERACGHALLLMSDCDGPTRTTLALYNLAMVRLRRGRVSGVESTLEIATAENRRAGNYRGLIRDLELWARLELAQGRVVAALARCSEAFQCLEEQGIEERRGVFELLAARAHGWLGRRDRAAAHLLLVPAPAFCELEPEERPAVWALAGLLEEAAAEVAGTPWAALWLDLVAGSRPRADAWQPLINALEPYRAARLVFDCELALPGAAPPALVRQAIVTLQKAGAEALAERLESRSISPWIALESYLSQPASNVEALADLLAAAGYGNARLTWVRHHREEVLIAGAGGPEVLSTAHDSGDLVLHTPLVDGTLRALFALIRRDLKVGERAPAAPVPTGILGESPKLRAAIDKIDQLARGELPILVLGESGTGKELAAHRIHTASRRSAAPFLAVNCAAFSETLVQSDLFGHVQGSFTGADRDRAGVFESARGGTVFLDEIGDLPLSLQGKLLRVLQEGEIRRVGESFARKVDVRVVAATHRDLEPMVQAGTFRQDLFFRLRGAVIFLPPLRERGEDVLLLADHFLAHRCGPARRLKKSARRRLLSYSWPGNVRELRNVLEMAASLAMDGDIDVEHLDLPGAPAAVEAGGYHERVEEFRKRLIADAVTEAGGNRAEAARRLGMSRQALSYLVRQLGLT